VELRILLVSLVRRILKPAYIKINNEGKFLTTEAFESLHSALNDPEAYLPFNSVDYGASFTIHLGKVKVPCEALNDVKKRCVNYLSVLCKQLVERLPINMHHYETLQYLTPVESLKPSPYRVDFFKLPLFLMGKFWITSFHILQSLIYNNV
jgi:hypothetical protein